MGELDVSDILTDATIVYTFDGNTRQLQSIVMNDHEYGAEHLRLWQDHRR